MTGFYFGTVGVLEGRETPSYQPFLVVYSAVVCNYVIFQQSIHLENDHNDKNAQDRQDKIYLIIPEWQNNLWQCTFQQIINKLDISLSPLSVHKHPE